MAHQTFFLEPEFQTANIPQQPAKQPDGSITCCCVYLCRQFAGYNVDSRTGIKIIPQNTPCVHEPETSCRGQMCFRNGIFAGKAARNMYKTKTL
jgi:hypothetical protein